MEAPRHILDQNHITLVKSFAHESRDQNSVERLIRCCICAQTFPTNHSYYTAYIQTGAQDDLSKDIHPDDLDVRAHGGLTYGPDKYGWVGFDFNHAGDRCVGEHIEQTSDMLTMGQYTTTWDEDSVEKEVRNVADQLAKNGL